MEQKIDVSLSLSQINNKNFKNYVLAVVAQWIECWPANHWLGSQSGHMPGLQAKSPVGGAGDATTH